MLSDEQKAQLILECKTYLDFVMIERIEAAATEPLLQRIKELEEMNAQLQEQNTEVDKACAELERQLEEARKQMEVQKDEWLAWEAKRKELEKDAERYRWLRDLDEDPVLSLAAQYTDMNGSAKSISQRIDAAIDALKGVKK